MRVLLDEQLDRRLKPLFGPGFHVETVYGLGWGGLRDDALLRAAQERFDALVTMDRSLPHQHNIGALSLGVVLVRAHSNRREVVAPLIPRVCAALRGLRPGHVVEVSQ